MEGRGEGGEIYLGSKKRVLRNDFGRVNMT
jgi:hypothetical protein